MTAGASTILVLDDEVTIRYLYRAILEAKGYCVVDTDSNDEGLALLKRPDSHIRLVLQDCQRPLGHCLGGGKGQPVADSGIRFYLEVLHRRFPGIPSVFCTGYTEQACRAFAGVTDVNVDRESKQRDTDRASPSASIWNRESSCLFRRAYPLRDRQGIFMAPHGFFLEKPFRREALEHLIELALNMWWGCGLRPVSNEEGFEEGDNCVENS